MILQNWYVHIECNFKVIDTNKFCLVDFNMATIFKDGRHGLYWITTLCLKVAADSQKLFGNQLYVLNFKNANLIS